MAADPAPRRARQRPAPLARSLRVAHAIPGRVRFQLAEEDRAHGAELARRMAAHPAVSATSWREASRSLLVHFDPSLKSGDLLGALPATAQEAAPARPVVPLWRQMLVPAASLTAGLLVPAAPGSVVIAACALPIARRALRGAVGRKLNIDVLDAVAVGLLLASGDVLAAGVSVGLIETGERIRRRASGRARRVLRSWLGTTPSSVRLHEARRERMIPLDEVKVGDCISVYAGESVPVDGVVIDGHGDLDDKTWSGEAMPRRVMASAQVLAGSSLYDGRVLIEVLASGDETRAAKLAIALEDAIAADTKVSDMFYRIADRFVLPVLATGGIVFALTGQLGRLVSILIIDYGTGFRVSIPTTVLTTMITGARQKVLFKNGRAIEELARVDTIVFDKTGTLTSGKPSVAAIELLADLDRHEVLRLAATAEGQIQHPMAAAIRRAARAEGVQAETPHEVRYQVGGGVISRVGERRVLVGQPALLAEHRIEFPTTSEAGSSVVLVAVDGRPVARLSLRDRVDGNAKEVLQRLRRLGVRRFILATGDRGSAAAAVSRQLGLDEYHGSMMPEAKVDLVRRLRAEGHGVAVVGDGINDALAMAEAGVGIAVPDGAHLARETADVVLLGEDLAPLPTAVRLAREAMGLMRQNIGLVAIPNSLGMGLAVAGQLTPLAATLVNNGSTILAAANALRPLQGTQPPAKT